MRVTLWSVAPHKVTCPLFEQQRLFCMTCFGSGWMSLCAYHTPEYQAANGIHDLRRNTRCICVACIDCSRLNAEGVDTRWLTV